MSSQGFSFPPPPPPPPRQQQSQQQHNHAPQYGQSYRGQRGGRGAGGNSRGRARAQGNKGGGRGGHYAAPSPAYSTNPAPPSVSYAPMNYAGFPTQPLSTAPTPAIAAPQYGSSYPPTSTAFTSPQTFSQPTAAQVSPYQHQTTSYDAYNQAMGQMAQAYAAMPYQHASPGRPWGYGQTAPTGTFPGAHQGNAWGPQPFNNNAYGNNMSNGDKLMKHHNKRDHPSAFGKPQSIAPRVPAPPPVPSFGNPLPSKPPPPSDVTWKPKKKRKHNQLGLTPKTEDHESSEEEDDVDEESKLASGSGGTANAPLRFTYRGRTATLKTPEEIAAWIAERKKRFPTQARVEEKKKAMEEAKKAREEAMKQKRESRKQETTKRPQKDTRERQQQRTPGDPVDAVAKATEKADKLRRKLEREQKRVAKAEADAERARLKVEELRKESTGLSKDGDVFQEAQSSATPAGHVSGEPAKPVHDKEAAKVTDTTDDNDWTSSSGSDESSSDSDSDEDEYADSDGSAPEEMTSRREGPEKVPPPPRTNVRKRVCRHFARNGRCLRGDDCNFLHELPERKAKTKPAAPQQKEKGRKGLLQMVCAIGTLHRITIRDL